MARYKLIKDNGAFSGEELVCEGDTIEEVAELALAKSGNGASDPLMEGFDELL